ncbi:hypothetical protein [Leifsonia sp. SIMBA_070]|uniref:hypothetical protein n=1 Tax=Leifsonia sp. SIMBA_070 TaxID=3085810 RepID=UPI00397E4B16
MKEIAWYVLGFSAAVCAMALGLLLAPDAADAAEGPGGLLQHLTSTEWADLLVALLFGTIAFVSGSYLSSRAAAAADDARPAATASPAAELIPAESAA